MKSSRGYEHDRFARLDIATPVDDPDCLDIEPLAGIFGNVSQ